jgi:cobalt-zinc-cadmium efflux system membrane fusion protein
MFRPTKEQWDSLKVAEVRTLIFRSSLTTDGIIAFNDDATTAVFSPFTGRVTRLIAQLGDVVKKGAPLMAMEASELVQGRSDVASAKASLDNARATEKRQQNLYDAGAGAIKDWRQSQADLMTAESALSAARGRLRILGKTDAEIDALEKAPAGGVSEAIVKAPIAGTITQRQVGVGQYITSAAGGATNPVFTIGNLSTVWLVANVREGDAPVLRVGQPAEVTVLALPGKAYKAKIAWVGPAVDPVIHRLPVRAEVKNPTGELKPQMFASFTIATSDGVEAPAVPKSALVYEGESARVFVVGPDDSIAGRTVQTGRSRDGMVEITSGLHAGEKVVTAGTLFIDRAVQGD